MSPSYAIVESGGKQYRVEKGGSLLVDRLPDDEGAKVTLRPVMYRADKQIVLEAGELEKVKIEAKVAEHLRGDKIRIFKYKPKKGYRRRAGHRSELTRLEVTDVKMLTRKPAARKPARREAGRREASRGGQACRRDEGRPQEARREEARGEEAGGEEAGREEAGREEASREEAGGEEAGIAQEFC